MKKYLFIIRSYNDIDHFTPVIDFILENKLAKIKIYSSEPLSNIYPNENLNYLFDQHNLAPNYLLENLNSMRVSLLDKLVFSLNNINSRFLFSKYIEFAINHLTRYFKKNLINLQEKLFKADIENKIEKINPDLVILDPQNPKIFPHNAITKKSKELKKPIVSLPHGLYTYLSTNPTWGDKSKIIKRERLNISLGINWDWFVVQNSIYKEYAIDSGIKKDSIITMGSVRYDYNWLNKQKKSLKKKIFKLEGFGKKIIIFPSKMHYRGNIKSYREIIEGVCKVSDRVVMKPHTRHMRLHFLKSSINRSGIKIINNEYSSNELIDWCDIGIVWGSSIGIQLLLQNKSLFYPKYAHELETIYDKYLPESVTNSTSDLTERIKSSKSPNYSQSNKENFINNIVYAGEPEKSPLKRYADFFSKITND